VFRREEYCARSVKKEIESAGACRRRAQRLPKDPKESVEVTTSGRRTTLLCSRANHTSSQVAGSVCGEASEILHRSWLVCGGS